jgi:hypothetical protein
VQNVIERLQYIVYNLQQCKICGFHGGDYEKWRLLGCYGVAIVRTDVSEELSTPVIRVTRIDELRTTLAVTSNRSTQRALLLL